MSVASAYPSLVPRAAVARLIMLAAAGVVVACADDPLSPRAPGFLGGTDDDRQIGLVVNSLGRSVTMFQLGSPTTQLQVELGTSSTITPVGLSVGGRQAAVPLGNAGSVALIDLLNATVTRFYTFASGNVTGSAFADETTVIVANSATNQVGRFTTDQTSTQITQLATVAPEPASIAVAAGRVLVVSANLDDNFVPIGNGIVTALDPRTLEVLGTVQTGGQNSTDAAVGPDGLLYVVNTGNYVSDGSVTVINPATLQVVTTVSGFGAGPGSISIDGDGLAYVSGFSTGTVVWNTTTRQFVRGPTNPVCAPIQGGGCRGAFDATANENGDLYQVFFGDPQRGLPPYVFVYAAGTFALRDSISVGSGPSSIDVRSY